MFRHHFVKVFKDFIPFYLWFQKTIYLHLCEMFRVTMSTFNIRKASGYGCQET